MRYAAPIAPLLLVSQAIEALSIDGPALGRPLVDTVKGSRLAHLKELRPARVVPRTTSI